MRSPDDHTDRLRPPATTVVLPPTSTANGRPPIPTRAISKPILEYSRCVVRSPRVDPALVIERDFSSISRCSRQLVLGPKFNVRRINTDQNARARDPTGIVYEQRLGVEKNVAAHERPGHRFHR